jgi:hypothetical protein
MDNRKNSKDNTDLIFPINDKGESFIGADDDSPI